MNSIPRFIIQSLFVFALIATSQSVQAQAPPLLWQRCYGGDSLDEIDCIRPTSDGGYIASGLTLSTDGDLAGNGGVTGLWVLKLDALDNIQWEKTYASYLSASASIEQTFDGGYILTCNNTIKLHSDGSIDWSISAGGSVVHQTHDSGYILCNGNKLTKLHPDGSVDWLQTYVPTYGTVSINDVCESFAGGYIVTGYASDIHPVPFTGKTDASGNLLTPIPNAGGHETNNIICKTPDGNYFNSQTGTSGCSVSKINDNLSTQWTTTASIPGLSLTGMSPTNDTGFVICGSNCIFSCGIYLRKFDITGNPQWEKDLGTSTENGGTSVFQAADGNYAIAGYEQNDATITGNHGGRDGYVAVLGTSNAGVQHISPNTSDIKVFPIPANDQLFIELPKGYENATLQLISVAGSKLSVREDNNGLSRTLFIGTLPAGNYLLEVINSGMFSSYKVVHY